MMKERLLAAVKSVSRASKGGTSLPIRLLERRCNSAPYNDFEELLSECHGIVLGVTVKRNPSLDSCQKLPGSAVQESEEIE